MRVYISNIRAIITKLLIEKYNLPQIEIAKRMGITQGAVSQYYNTLRGSKTNLLSQNREVLDILEQIALKISNNEIDYNLFNEKICEICKILNNKQGCNNEKNIS